MKFPINTSSRFTFAQFGFLLLFSLLINHNAKAEIVELTVTGYWSEGDIKVTNIVDKSYDPANPKFDGKVFGIEPSAGNLKLHLRVNTEGQVFFPKGATFTADGAAYSLTHDFYGYRDVTLVDDTYSFGSAVWKTDGILAGLEGPNKTKAALWTDVDIAQQDPTRVSFRMFGKADGLSADLFIGSRTRFAIGRQFLMWEYYKGEEIRSANYTAKSKVVSQ